MTIVYCLNRKVPAIDGRRDSFSGVRRGITNGYRLFLFTAFAQKGVLAPGALWKLVARSLIDADADEGKYDAELGRTSFEDDDFKHLVRLSESLGDISFSPYTLRDTNVTFEDCKALKQSGLRLAAVLDLHSRKMVGWAKAPGMPATLVCTALKMAIAQRNPAHLDWLCIQQYVPKRQLLGGLGVCHNAVMERFFLNLKRERIWQKDCANHAEAISYIADYIINFYNAGQLVSHYFRFSDTYQFIEGQFQNLWRAGVVQRQLLFIVTVRACAVHG